MSTAAASRGLLFLLAIASLSLAGCGGAPPVLKIGLVAPFEGRGRFVGYDIIYSARLAVRQANRSEQLAPYRVALVTLDDGGTVEGARNAAATLIADPAVIAVVGHGLAETGAAATALYEGAGVPFVPLPSAGLTAVDPARLPAAFRAAYADVTPFDEEAGPLAAPAYDAFSLLLAAFAERIADGQRPSRDNIANTLPNLTVRGITGRTVPGN